MDVVFQPRPTRIWPWADSHQSRDWPWPHNVSTFKTLVKKTGIISAALNIKIFLWQNATFVRYLTAAI
jgi:hypothetical protein